MKAKESIQIAYSQVRSQAQKLDNCANDLQNLQRKLDALMNDLRGGWTGESAELYLQKCSELSQKLDASRKNLDRTADAIRTTAKAYRDAELLALQLVQN